MGRRPASEGAANVPRADEAGRAAAAPGLRSSAAPSRHPGPRLSPACSSRTTASETTNATVPVNVSHSGIVAIDVVPGAAPGERDHVTSPIGGLAQAGHGRLLTTAGGDRPRPRTLSERSTECPLCRPNRPSRSTSSDVPRIVGVAPQNGYAGKIVPPESGKRSPCSGIVDR